MPSPWQGTGIHPGFLEETLESARCSRSDRTFLSCVGAVQRVLDLHGRHLQLIPASDLAGLDPPRRPLQRFGAAVVIEDPALRINAPGNALEVMRARASYSSTRSATSPIPTAMPICSSRSSHAATRRNPP